jgi:hypothetical protein
MFFLGLVPINWIQGMMFKAMIGAHETMIAKGRAQRKSNDQ